jgi:hypothetical protein
MPLGRALGNVFDPIRERDVMSFWVCLEATPDV